MSRPPLSPPLRQLLGYFLLATRALRSAARAGDLERLQVELDHRQALLEELSRAAVDPAEHPRVRRVVAAAELGATRAMEALADWSAGLTDELRTLHEHRQRGSAFRRSVMARPAAGTWLDLST